MKRTALWVAALSALLILVTACGGSRQSTKSKLAGEIRIDGSSTVFPITEAVAEEFKKVHPNVRVPVGVSGTGGGFKKWAKGEIDINNSSRPIKESEAAEATGNGITAVEIPVAYDGLSVVVHKDNNFLTCITMADLKKIWDTNSTVKLWSDVNPAYPAENIRLYGPGTDSGTFDYFTEEVNGKSQQSRSDFTASEDDHILVEGVAGNRFSLGYFGYAYYVESKSKVKLVQVDKGKGCVEPNDATIADLTYPLARFIYIYPSAKSMEREEVKEFVKFYLQQATELVSEVGYTPLPKRLYDEQLAKIK